MKIRLRRRPSGLRAKTWDFVDRCVGEIGEVISTEQSRVSPQETLYEVKFYNGIILWLWKEEFEVLKENKE